MMKRFEFTVSDYEHEGDLENAISEVRNICPQATNFKSWEERDYEAESDYEDEYGECDENIYRGYISFDAPKDCEQLLNNLQL